MGGGKKSTVGCSRAARGELDATVLLSQSGQKNGSEAFASVYPKPEFGNRFCLGFFFLRTHTHAKEILKQPSYYDTKATIPHDLLICTQCANYTLHIKPGYNKILCAAHRNWVCGNVKPVTFAA